MTLIDFIKSIEKQNKKLQLMWIFLLSQSNRNNKIALSVLVFKYKISKATIYRVFSTNKKPIIINDKEVYFYIKSADVCWSTLKKKPLELSSKHKKDVEYVLNMLNQMTGKEFNSSSDVYAKAIIGRLEEGYKLEDFEKVIYIQSTSWLGTEYEKHLRPQTIFGKNFDSYLNSPLPKVKQDSGRLQHIKSAIDKAKEFDWEAHNETKKTPQK